MLVLFDVDATLISTAGVGMRALEKAGKHLHGESFDASTTEYAGRLDPLIFGDLLSNNGIEPTADALDSLRRGYAEHLVVLLDEPGAARVLPGVRELLDRLGTIDGLVIGLLTGNFPETGAIKLRACGIEPDSFAIRVWGDESPRVPPAREHLPPVALDRYQRLTGQSLDPRHGVVIGDTAHDISCAHASGMRALAVATGYFGVSELASADRAVADLSDTDSIVSWITGSL